MMFYSSFQLGFRKDWRHCRLEIYFSISKSCLPNYNLICLIVWKFEIEGFQIQNVCISVSLMLQYIFYKWPWTHYQTASIELTPKILPSIGGKLSTKFNFPPFTWHTLKSRAPPSMRTPKGHWFTKVGPRSILFVSPGIL
jgi:hypothetical protein